MVGIGSDKAPGLDGFNSYFFKKSWDFIKNDVCTFIHEFFNTSRMHTPLNCTVITLIPKIHNATRVKDFRHIACCTMLYKIISKILTNRLQRVIGEVVNEAQSGFIPGRHIADNILLVTELI